MQSKVTIGGQAVHPMLVGFPLALYTAATVSYVVYQFTASVFWFRVGYVANVAGVFMAILAAIPGLIDWTKAIPKNTVAKRTGGTHIILNSAALLFFGWNALLQSKNWGLMQPVANGSVILSIIGIVCASCAAYFGRQLVQRHHISIDMTPDPDGLDTKDLKTSLSGRSV